jgi:preprotein translocase subunit SecE
MATPTIPNIQNIGPVQYIRETRKELSLVTWPTRMETLKLTGIVISLSVAVALYIGALDITFINITSLLYNH